MRKNIIVLISLLFFTSAAQAEEIDPKYFKSWITLSELLQYKGILPSGPSWAVIIPMCLPLKKGDDETGYNRCLYEKVMDEYQWPTDYKYCESKSEQEYSSEYTNNADQQKQLTPHTIIITNGNKTTQIIDYIPATTTFATTLKPRTSYFHDCMAKEKNWNSTDKWTMGRHKPEKEPEKPKLIP